MEYSNYKIVHRRYASLYVIMAVDNDEVSFRNTYLYLIIIIYLRDTCKGRTIGQAGPMNHYTFITDMYIINTTLYIFVSLILKFNCSLNSCLY